VAYDEGFAQRVREHLDGMPSVEEKRMFGGLAFMVRGHMCVGVVGRELMVRVGPEDHAEALRRPHARPMDFTGRPLRGFVYVGSAGIAADEDLAQWVERALAFNRTQPAK